MMLRAVNKKGEKVLEMQDNGKIKVTEKKLLEEMKKKAETMDIEDGTEEAKE